MTRDHLKFYGVVVACLVVYVWAQIAR